MNFTYRGKEYQVKPSTRDDKQSMVNVNGKIIHFGDPDMKEYPGTQRGDNYCTRSLGIKDRRGNPTANNIMSPNFWSRKVLWNCDGKRSLK